MKLAILGTDAHTLALIDAALVEGHSVAWLGDVRPDDRAAIAGLLPRVPEATDWESVLDHSLVDAVIVGRGTAPEALRAEQLKRLVADIMPVLAVHPIGSSVLPYYELDMGRREMHVLLRHYNPVVGSPSVAELADWVFAGEGDIGPVDQVVCERFSDDCGREAVLQWLARDAELLRAVGGVIRSVSAVGPAAEAASFASLQTQMATDGPASLRWSVTRAPAAARRLEVTLIGHRGTARLRIDDHQVPAAESAAAEAQPWRVVVDGEPIPPPTPPTPPWHAARAAIGELAAALPANGFEQSEARSTWHQATAAMEVVDAVQLSLQKQRMVEVHPQRLTEQMAFRGTMSAIGCGLLLLLPLVLIVAGVAGDTVGVPLMRFWPWALMVLLAAFLLLQVVPLLVTKRAPPSQATIAQNEKPPSEP